MQCPAHIRIGTRGSRLAIAQALEVKNRLLGAFPDQLTQHQIEIVKITTSGDRIQDRTLAEIGGKGLFTKEIEEALFNNSIDMAVHSMKDMPDKLPDGFVIDTILEREDPRDALISLKARNIEKLPKGAVIGTSSLRRQANLLRVRPDLKIIPFRGNVITRLSKLKKGEVDATILAMAGLKRIDKVSDITTPISTDDMLPAIGQGAIGVECSEENAHIREILSHINHKESYIKIEAERSLLKAIGGSCVTPLGALAELNQEQNRISIRANLLSPDGKEVIEGKREGSVQEARELGADLGKEIAASGSHLLC